MFMPLITYKVKKGDNLTSIIKKKGFPSSAWPQIYKAPYNAPLRKKRPDPNMILPGDEVKYPMFSKKDLKRVYDAIWEVVKVFEYAAHYENEALKVVKKVHSEAKKRPEEVLKSAEAYRGKYSVVVPALKARDAYAKCLREIKGSLVDTILNSCKGDYDAKINELNKSEDLAVQITEPHFKDAKKRLKSMKDLETSLGNSIKRTRAISDALVKAGDFVSNAAKETY